MSDADHQVIGKVGRVTDSIEPGKLGEVMISIRGGSEAYNAYGEPSEKGIIDKGERVVVVDYLPPRTIVVSRSGF